MSDNQQFDDIASEIHERAIKTIGEGRYHKFLLFVLFLASMVVGSQLFYASVMLIAATTDFGMTGFMEGIFTGAYYVGNMVCSIPSGYFADRYGRRVMLIAATIMQAATVLVTSLVTNYYVGVMMRVLSGISVGAITPPILSMASETFPVSKRGKMMAVFETGLTAGIAYEMTVAYFTIQNLESKWLTFSSWFLTWRGFTLVIDIPVIIAAICSFCLKESPLFLLKRRRISEAFEIYNQLSKKFDISSSRDLDEMKATMEDANTKCSPYSDHVFLSPRSNQYQLSLFHKDILNITISISLVQLISFSAASIVSTWSSVYLYETLENTDSDFLTNLSPVTRARYVFLLTAACSCPSILFGLLGGYLMDQIGRKPFFYVSLILCCLSSVIYGVFLYNLVPVITVHILFNTIFLSFADNGLWILSAESFPTQIRCTATGWAAMCNGLGATMGSLIAGLLSSSMRILWFVTALLFGLSILPVWPLPETRNKLM